MSCGRLRQRSPPLPSRFTPALPFQVIGVRPEVGLAKAAGLELGPRGGIKVRCALLPLLNGCLGLASRPAVLGK